MWRRALVLARVIALSGALAGNLGCGEAPASIDEAALERDFPAHGGRVLQGGAALVAGERGFVVDGDERSAWRRGLSAVLPRSPDEGVRFELPSGLAVRVRERDLVGDGAPVGRAVGYARLGGTSYWTAFGGAYEEWLALDPGVATGEGPAAAWDVDGGELREREGTVEVLDAAGTPRLRVTAPEAFTAAGARIAPRLAVRGSTLELWADAGGERLLVDPAWSATSDMITQRDAHSATLLPSGAVLVAGGMYQEDVGSCGVPPTTSFSIGAAEIYDPLLQVWSSAGSMSARQVHEATLLQSGKVLVTGGLFTAGCNCFCDLIVPLDDVNLYDPAANAWSVGPPMSKPRGNHTATLLADGKVLAVGGGNSGGTLPSAEIYDPASGTWSPTTSMSVPRTAHKAVRLLDGRVLLALGINGNVPLTSAVVFDPSQSTWSAAGSTAVARGGSQMVLLQDGRVLLLGGYSPSGSGILDSTEIYDPATNTWAAAAPMLSKRSGPGAVVLADGRVLVAGGDDGNGVPLATSELYDPIAGTWSLAGIMPGPASGLTLTLLQGGKVLGAGGSIGYDLPTLKTAELFDPSATCASDAACASGHCVDGVCCDTACGGGVADCQACSIAAGAPADGTCVPLTGTACEDGDACTQADQCQAGACVAGSPKVCNALDACHDPGVCDPATGQCDSPSKADGLACDDGNACTQADTCQGGACVGTSQILCGPLDVCHKAGVCNPATGHCSNPSKPNGFTCDDGDACTGADACFAGACTGTAVVCTALDECHMAGTCDPQAGCSNPAKADGTACSIGACQGGICVGASSSASSTASSSGSASSSAASSSAASSGAASSGSGGGAGGNGGGGAGGDDDPPAAFGGCGCGVPGSPAGGGAGLGLALLLLVRRRRASATAHS